MRPGQGEQQRRRRRRLRGEGRRRKRSDRQRTIVEQRRLLFSYERRGRPPLVEPKIKAGEDSSVKRMIEGRGESYIGSRTTMTVCLTWRGSSFDIEAEILNSWPTDDRRRIGGGGGGFGLCLVENPSLMSRRYDIPRLGLLPSCVIELSMLIDRAADATLGQLKDRPCGDHTAEEEN